MKKILNAFLSAILFSSALLASSSARGQGATPLTLPLFQNGNASCQDQDAVDESYTATCGAFTGEDPGFPDCVATTELRPEASSGPETVPLFSYFENQNIHDASSCGAQFAAGVQTDVTYPQNDGVTRYLGSVVNADFSGSGFSDVIYPVTQDEDNIASVLEEVISEAGGGFATSVDLGILPSLELGLAVPGENPLTDFTSFRTDYWARDANFTFGDACDPVVGSRNVVACASDKSVVAVDCNGDGAPDSVTAVAVGNPIDPNSSVVNLRTHVNGGGGLNVPPLDTVVANLAVDDSVDDDLVAASVASGDFGGAGDDIVVAIFTTIFPDLSQLVVCQNDGACGYTCRPPLSLGALTGADFSWPFSAAAGDFNGDGSDDAVVSLTGTENGSAALLSQLLYVFGDGAGNLAGPLLVSTVRDGSGNALLNVGGADFVDMVPTSLSVGQFDNDGILDVAVTNFHGPVADPSDAPTPFTQALPQGNVVVFTSNGSSGGGFAPLPTALSFPTQELFNGNGVSLGTFSAARASGIASADFDRCGGDDLIALAELCLPSPIVAGGVGPVPIIDTNSGNCDSTVQRIASVFLNANEAPVADAGPDLDGTIDTALPIVATCQDPSLDDRTFSWTITSAPSGATATVLPATGSLFDPDIDADASFQADTPGVYNLTLSCVDFCGLEGSDSVVITVSEAAVFTQGGCIASLAPASGGAWTAWLGLGLLPLLFGRLRQRCLQ